MLKQLEKELLKQLELFEIENDDQDEITFVATKEHLKKIETFWNDNYIIPALIVGLPMESIHFDTNDTVQIQMNLRYIYSQLLCTLKSVQIHLKK
jgi:hypothetical protein